jgi:hypothetical protein
MIKNKLNIIIMLSNNIYYTTKGIYGVKIYTYINKDCTIIFKKELNTLMSNELIEEVKAFYENLDENSKKNLKFQIYIKCKSIEDGENCMIWWNVSLNEFITYFGI